MQNKNLRWLLALLVAVFTLCFARTALSAPVTTFEDITFWVGTGDNQAAMVVDWGEGSSEDESLVWGYRWTDTATGSEMLRAIVEADDRLFAKIDSANTILFGMGYDLNDDGTFSIDDGTVFDAQGFAISGPPDSLPPFATAMSNDQNDSYREGWISGFWNYGINDGGASPFAGGGWIADEQGMADRTLSDGDWDSWAFMSLPLPPAQPMPPFDAFAENPVAAEAPLAADFNSDGDIDGADFLTWQRGFGIASGAMLSQGDANDDGVVDEIDLQLWTAGYGASSWGGAQRSAQLVVPEPSCITGVLCFLLLSHYRYLLKKVEGN